MFLCSSGVQIIAPPTPPLLHPLMGCRAEEMPLFVPCRRRCSLAKITFCPLFGFSVSLTLQNRMSAPTTHGWLKLDTHCMSHWKPKPYGPIRPARVEEAPVAFCCPAWLSTVVNKDLFKSSQAGLSACNNANKAEARCLDRLSYPASSKKRRGASAYGLTDGSERRGQCVASPFCGETWR